LGGRDEPSDPVMRVTAFGGVMLDIAQEHAEALVGRATSQTPVPREPGDRQVLGHDQIMYDGEPGGKLVGVIGPRVTDPAMLRRDQRRHVLTVLSLCSRSGTQCSKESPHLRNVPEREQWAKNHRQVR
jgi:hypothetical protein